MANKAESFGIRIRKDGTIYFRSRQLGDERMRQLREMIEDSLGEVAEIRAVDDDDGTPPGVGIVDDEHREELRGGKGGK